MMYLLLGVGLMLLMGSGELLVRGATGLAARAGISPLIIALTVVALGTSMPELVISISATLQGSPDIAIGNVVGSNIANILLVLGLPAIIYPIVCRSKGLRLNTGIMLATTVLLIIFCAIGPLTRNEGLAFLTLLAAYLAWSAWEARKHTIDSRAHAIRAVELVQDVSEAEQFIKEELKKPAVTSRMVITAFIAIGCIGLPIGAQMVILGGTDLARVLGVPEAVIALSLIALGTSLPELATSLMAAARQRHDLAIGNAIGSNIINILMTLGVTALIKPIPIAENFLRIDLWVMLIAALAIVPTVAARGSITRAKGMVFVLTYAIYMFVIFSLNHL